MRRSNRRKDAMGNELTTIEEQITKLTDEHASNVTQISLAAACKVRQREIVKELAVLYRERTKAVLAEMRGR